MCRIGSSIVLWRREEFEKWIESFVDICWPSGGRYVIASSVAPSKLEDSLPSLSYSCGLLVDPNDHSKQRAEGKWCLWHLERDEQECWKESAARMPHHMLLHHVIEQKTKEDKTNNSNASALSIRVSFNQDTRLHIIYHLVRWCSFSTFLASFGRWMSIVRVVCTLYISPFVSRNNKHFNIVLWNTCVLHAFLLIVWEVVRTAPSQYDYGCTFAFETAGKAGATVLSSFETSKSTAFNEFRVILSIFWSVLHCVAIVEQYQLRGSLTSGQTAIKRIKQSFSPCHMSDSHQPHFRSNPVVQDHNSTIPIFDRASRITTLCWDFHSVHVAYPMLGTSWGTVLVCGWSQQQRQGPMGLMVVVDNVWPFWVRDMSKIQLFIEQV